MLTIEDKMAEALTIGDRGVTAKEGSTKARIERAALTLFATRGIEGATTREIAAAAGVSEGALYRHFKGKEQIASHLFEAIHERLARLVREAGASANNIDKQAEAIVEAYCSTAEDDWTLFSYHLLAMAHFLPSPPGGDDPVSATEDIITAAMKREELSKRDPHLLAAMALGVVLQPALHKVYGRLSEPLGAYADQFKRNIIAVLHGNDEKQ